MTTTTTLVHRVYNGPLEWWRDGLVYEIGSAQVGAADLDAAHGILDHVASLGFNVVLVRPSRVPTDGDLSSFRSFAGRAHELGLRVIARISGALGPVTGAHARDANPIFIDQESGEEKLLQRAAAFLAEGADGVDLGTIVPPQVSAETDLDLLSEHLALLQALVAEHVDDGLIGADVSADYPDALRHHLQDDWLHHLRDDALMLTRWEADSLTRHITHSLDEHDRFGAPPVWRYLPSYRLVRSTDPGDGYCWFETSDEERGRRSLALQALVLALPGAVYLRQGDEISLPDKDKPSSTQELARLINERSGDQGDQFGSPLSTVRHATYVRQEHALATGPFAFVVGLDWCPADVLTFLNRDILVLVNTSDRGVALPEQAQVLLASAALVQEDRRLLVPPTTTAWLQASTVA